jgi:D-beta-D-heptose 7-phosphate kinase/D-beta-D-heptose 1-phosphate adenosyltransferase
MNGKKLSLERAKELLDLIARQRVLVIGDAMLDQFLWGRVARISPEAPVPIVEFERESFMPGGAANVCRNLADLKGRAMIAGVAGRDPAGRQLAELLAKQAIDCRALLFVNDRLTSIKTRIVAHQQQVVRVDRETRRDLEARLTRRLLAWVRREAEGLDAIIVGDYGKGVVTQPLLDGLKRICRERGIWLSLDPKPVHHLNLEGLSLITPNRKEAFELSGIEDWSAGERPANPLEDDRLMRTAAQLLGELRPALLLITLGDQGMLLCQTGREPFHIHTVAQEVFDVSGAGDTVIASFTLAVAAGASPAEAAVFSNHAAGVVVGKVGTATAHPEEIIESFRR